MNENKHKVTKITKNENVPIAHICQIAQFLFPEYNVQ